METSEFQTELQTARDRVRLVQADHDGAAVTMKQLEGKLATADADHLQAVERAITEGLPHPAEPDVAAIRKQLAMARVRVKAFTTLLAAQQKAVQRVEAQTAARKRQEFEREATPAVTSMMGALREAVEKITAARLICEKHGFPFRQLPIDLSAPPGCGGFARPDPVPEMRLKALIDLPHLFSQVGDIPKLWTLEDRTVAERSAQMHELQEADRLKREAAEAQHKIDLARMRVGQFGMTLGAEVEVTAFK